MQHAEIMNFELFNRHSFQYSRIFCAVLCLKCFSMCFSVSSVRYQGSARQGWRVLVKLSMPPEAKARKIHLFAKDKGWIGKISVDRFSGPTNESLNNRCFFQGSKVIFTFFGAHYWYHPSVYRSPPPPPENDWRLLLQSNKSLVGTKAILFIHRDVKILTSP
jgi:hypothetical protein